MKKARMLVTMLLAVVFCLSLIGCGGGNEAQDGVRTYKVGIATTDIPIWDSINERLAEHNIKLEYFEISDYQIPNTVLNDGEIDLNSFQTEIFLKDFCESHNMDLSVLAYTYVAPLGIYSEKITDLSQLQDGATISIPNDATNCGRALLLLQAQGLITLKEDCGLLPSELDIVENPHNYKITAMDAAQLPRSLPDVDISVINNGNAYQAGLTLKDDALVYEDPNAEGMENYWNVIAVRTEDLENEDFKLIRDLYYTQETADEINEAWGGNLIPVFEIPEAE